MKLRRVHAAEFGVYGVRKLWRQLQREGIGDVLEPAERRRRLNERTGTPAEHVTG